MDAEAENEISTIELLRRIWARRLLVLAAAGIGAVMATIAWIMIPVTVGTTYKLSIYPDGAPLYSTAAIRTQLSLALAAAGYAPIATRDGTITVRVAGSNDGTQFVGTALAVTASIHASIRRAIERAGPDCGEFCARLVAWADAHDAEMFELISVSVSQYRRDDRAAFAAVSFVAPIILAILLVLILPAVRRLGQAINAKPPVRLG